MGSDRDGRPLGCSLEACLRDKALTDGQRRRLRLFQQVEEGVGRRVAQLCVRTGLDVRDAAVLVVAPMARRLFVVDRGLGLGSIDLFGCVAWGGDDREGSAPRASVVLGHRERLRDLLRAALPPADDAPYDPYVDLLEPSPAQCVRVLIVDDEAITVLSYGAFVTLDLSIGRMPQA